MLLIYWVGAILRGEYLPKDFDKSMAWLENDRAEELMVYCRFLQIAELSKKYE